MIIFFSINKFPRAYILQEKDKIVCILLLFVLSRQIHKSQEIKHPPRTANKAAPVICYKEIQHKSFKTWTKSDENKENTVLACSQQTPTQIQKFLLGSDHAI